MVEQEAKKKKKKKKWLKREKGGEQQEDRLTERNVSNRRIQKPGSELFKVYT